MLYENNVKSYESQIFHHVLTKLFNFLSIFAHYKSEPDSEWKRH